MSCLMDPLISMHLRDENLLDPITKERHNMNHFIRNNNYHSKYHNKYGIKLVVWIYSGIIGTFIQLISASLGFLLILAMLLNISFEFTFAWGYALTDKTNIGHPYIDVFYIPLTFISTMIFYVFIMFFIANSFRLCLLLVWNTLDKYQIEIVIVWRWIRIILCIIFAYISNVINNVGVKLIIIRIYFILYHKIYFK